MQSVFAIITKLIASRNYFCKEVFCNNFGRDGIGLRKSSFAKPVSSSPSPPTHSSRPRSCKLEMSRLVVDPVKDVWDFQAFSMTFFLSCSFP